MLKFTMLKQQKKLQKLFSFMKNRIVKFMLLMEKLDVFCKFGTCLLLVHGDLPALTSLIQVY